jgi:ATP-dependent DNA helicase RecG
MNKYLLPENILPLIQSGEGYNAEFKVSLPKKLKELSEEICAFANASMVFYKLRLEKHDF